MPKPVVATYGNSRHRCSAASGVEKAVLLGLSPELGDAAKIDGCSEFGVFWRVMLPLAAPGISILAVLQFIAAWKEFLISLLYMQKEELRPLVLGLMFFKTA